MNSAENKKLMQDIFAEMAKGNGKLFVDSLADDFTWTIAGATKWSRTFRGKNSVVNDLLKPLFAQFADTYTATPKRFIAEDDLVVVEFSGRATTKKGQPYNNNYCCIYRIADGKLKEMTEYLDTELVSAALEDPGSGM